jgi:Zn-dependent M28 family amino/carboxypeptidase
MGITGRVRKDLEYLAGELGERNDGSDASFAALRAAADYIDAELRTAGWDCRRDSFPGASQRRVDNVVAERRGSTGSGDVWVVGAHYDSVRGGPGANDNCSGVTVLLALARSLADYAPECTLRLVAFSNEEHPHTRRPSMGSLVYASRCRSAGERVQAMLSLETLGTSGVQTLALVGNLRSRGLTRRLAAMLSQVPSGLAVRPVVLPGFVPGVRSSDHWSFWKQGYPAVMLTDGGPLRYRHYHRPTDTVDRVDVAKLAALSTQIECVLRATTTSSAPPVRAA